VAQTIIVPIRNLQIYRDIKIGHVLFIKSAESVDKDQPYYSKIQEMISIKEEDKTLPESFLNAKKAFRECTLAVYTSSNDDNQDAREDAQKNIERSLDVLRFYLSRTMVPVDPIFHNMFMAMEGLAYTGLTVALGVKPDGSTHTQYARTGYVSRYEITEEIMGRIEERNLDELNKILLKPDESRSPFEKSLLTSIDFYGNGMNEYNYRNRFVSFIISLESLLLGERGRKAVLAERAALILGPNSETRQCIEDRISYLYDIRSKIVHEGKDDEVTLQNIRLLSSTVFEIIVKLINYTSKINDKPALKKEVKKLKYSGPAF
jgi:hypothetical protein